MLSCGRPVSPVNPPNEDSIGDTEVISKAGFGVVIETSVCLLSAFPTLIKKMVKTFQFYVYILCHDFFMLTNRGSNPRSFLFLV